MDKKDILKVIEKIRQGRKRNFTQSFDIIINLRQLDLKKPDQRVDSFVVLPHNIRRVKICGLVDKELITESKKVFDKTIAREEFKAIKKEEVKKVAKEYDYFVAQATIMTDVAKFFGKTLGQRGKMPNPKAGCVVPPNANLENVKDRLGKTVRLQTKNELIVKCILGKEDMKDDDIVDNIISVYNSLIAVLPHDKQNVRNVMLKLTMGNAVLIGNEKSS